MSKPLLLLACLALCGCAEEKNLVSSRGAAAFHTVEIEGCEYLLFENGYNNFNNYAVAITHKGNCKNPIHRK